MLVQIDEDFAVDPQDIISVTRAPVLPYNLVTRIAYVEFDRVVYYNTSKSVTEIIAITQPTKTEGEQDAS